MFQNLHNKKPELKPSKKEINLQEIIILMGKTINTVAEFSEVFA